MDDNTKASASHLYLVRLWLTQSKGQEDQAEQAEWRGRVQHVITGRAGQFDSQASLVSLFRSLASAEPDPGNSNPSNQADPQESNSNQP